MPGKAPARCPHPPSVIFTFITTENNDLSFLDDTMMGETPSPSPSSDIMLLAFGRFYIFLIS